MGKALGGGNKSEFLVTTTTQRAKPVVEYQKPTKRSITKKKETKAIPATFSPLK